MRLYELLAHWASERHESVAWSTFARERTCIQNIASSWLGDIYIDELLAFDLQRWLDERAANYSRSDVAKHLNVLRAVTKTMAQRYDLEWIGSGLEITKSSQAVYTEDDPNVFAPDELCAFLDRCRTKEPRWFPLFAFMAWTGTRQCEATALRWSDVDLPAGKITIRRSQVDGHHRARTKTGAVVTQPITDALGILLDQTPRHGDLVFATSKGKAPGRKALWSAMRRVVDALLAEGIIAHRVTPHGLRRTLNNLLRAHTDGIVQRSITGHATPAMSEHYSHVSLGEKRVVLELVQGGMPKVGPKVGVSDATATPAAEANPIKLSIIK